MDNTDLQNFNTDFAYPCINHRKKSSHKPNQIELLLAAFNNREISIDRSRQPSRVPQVFLPADATAVVFLRERDSDRDGASLPQQTAWLRGLHHGPDQTGTVRLWKTYAFLRLNSVEAHIKKSKRIGQCDVVHGGV